MLELQIDRVAKVEDVLLVDRHFSQVTPPGGGKDAKQLARPAVAGELSRGGGHP